MDADPLVGDGITRTARYALLGQTSEIRGLIEQMRHSEVCKRSCNEVVGESIAVATK